MRSAGRPSRAHHVINEPVAGYYKRRLVSGGPWVPVHLFYGAPADPETGEELDRAPRWQAKVGSANELFSDAGEEGIIQWIWTSCCANPITEAEYRFMCADAEWCRENAQHLPEANPTKRIDLAALPSLF